MPKRRDTPTHAFVRVQVPGRGAAGQNHRTVSPYRGLVFADLDADAPMTEAWSYEVIPRLMKHPQVAAAFGGYYVGSFYRWNPTPPGRNVYRTSLYRSDGACGGVAINPFGDGVARGGLSANVPLWLMINGTLFETTSQEIHDQCLELHKLIGCEKCPHTEDVCLRRTLSFPQDEPLLHRAGVGRDHDVTSEAFELRRAEHQRHECDVDDWVPWKTQIDEFVLLPSVYASGDARPGADLPVLGQLSFLDINAVRDELSARATAAAKTRNTKQKECTRCHLGGKGYKNTAIPCDKYAPRHCEHGAWSKEDLIKYSIEGLRAQLDSAGLTMRQFEQMLALGGEVFPWRPKNATRTQEWVVGGFRHTYVSVSSPFLRGTQVRVTRTARKYRDEPLDISLDTLMALLPEELRRKYDEAPEVSEETLAIAAQLSCIGMIKSYSGAYQGGYQSVQPNISHYVARTYGGVEVGYWLQSYWRNFTLSSLDDVYARFDQLPMFNAHNVAKGNVPGNFTYCACVR